MTTRDLAIDLDALVKRYGHHRALDGLDLEVGVGEVHGFLGPNGAGKSTTLRAMLGLLRVDEGRASVLGLDPWNDTVALHRRLAYVPGDVTLWPRLSGGEAIDLLTRLRGGADRGRRDELVERFDFDPTKKGHAYSKGNRQKVALIAAFAADVDLLLLDEPTSGLDPLMEQVFRECLAEAKARGTTVLLSSHILSEVEQLADRVSIIRAGRRVETGSLKELRHLLRTHVEVTFARPLDDDERAVVQPLSELQDGVAEPGRTFAGEIEPSDVGAVVARVAHVGGGPVDVAATPASLERIFLTQYGRDEG